MPEIHHELDLNSEDFPETETQDEDRNLVVHSNQPESRVSRRNFLKVGGLFLAGAALESALPKSVKAAFQGSENQGRIIEEDVASLMKHDDLLARRVELGYYEMFYVVDLPPDQAARMKDLNNLLKNSPGVPELKFSMLRTDKFPPKYEKVSREELKGEWPKMALSIANGHVFVAESTLKDGDDILLPALGHEASHKKSDIYRLKVLNRWLKEKRLNQDEWTAWYYKLEKDADQGSVAILSELERQGLQLNGKLISPELVLDFLKRVKKERPDQTRQFDNRISSVRKSIGQHRELSLRK